MFFNDIQSWTWYVLEFDGKDTFFGYVDGDYQELDYFSLSELESIRGPLGLKVERDVYWKPKPLSEVKKEISKAQKITLTSHCFLFEDFFEVIYLPIYFLQPNVVFQNIV
jgi:hypothetical protein